MGFRPEQIVGSILAKSKNIQERGLLVPVPVWLKKIIMPAASDHKHNYSSSESEIICPNFFL
jgi:hypothetical protein